MHARWLLFLRLPLMAALKGQGGMTSSQCKDCWLKTDNQLSTDRKSIFNRFFIGGNRLKIDFLID